MDFFQKDWHKIAFFVNFFLNGRLMGKGQSFRFETGTVCMYECI